MVLAVCFSLFGFCFSLLRSRFSLLVQWLHAAYYLLNPARYSFLATPGHLSLLSSRLMSSADRCTSLRIDHPCSRCFIRFSTRKYPPQCSSNAVVFLLFISQHANRLLHFVSRYSQIPVRILLFSARRSIRLAQFLFFASLCVPLRSCYSYLAARRLLLSFFNFFNFNLSVKNCSLS